MKTRWQRIRRSLIVLGLGITLWLCVGASRVLLLDHAWSHSGPESPGQTQLCFLRSAWPLVRNPLSEHVLLYYELRDGPRYGYEVVEWTRVCGFGR